ncbi:MAG: hypothetical protein JW940_34345 [Polyangiaceae bacterium]|nr:hypothetical protein [Polyangiaceae bacterium]
MATRPRPRRSVGLVLLAATALAGGCKADDKPSSRPAAVSREAVSSAALSGAASTAEALKSATPNPSASTDAQAATRSDPGAAPATTAPCKAVGKRGQLALATQSGTFVSHILRTRGDHLFLLISSQPNARFTLLRIMRDGSTKTALGHLPGVGSPDGLWLTPDGAYTTFKRDLWRFPLAGGDAVLLAQGFSRSIAIEDGHVYGIQCGKADKKEAKTGKTDALVRAAMGGDRLAVLAKITRRSKECDYRGLAVDGTDAVLTDWPGRRLLSVSLSDGTVRVAATGHAFPRDVVMGPQDIDFATSKGLYRIAKAAVRAAPISDIGAAPAMDLADESNGLYRPAKRASPATRLSGVGATPFMDLAGDQTHYWIFQGEPYEPTESIWRLPRSGGKATKVWTFANRGAEQGTGIDAIAVDEQCVYYLQYAKSGDYFTVFARAKPE